MLNFFFKKKQPINFRENSVIIKKLKYNLKTLFVAFWIFIFKVVGDAFVHISCRAL